MAWEYVKNLDGAVLPMIPAIAGGTIAAGDALVISAGKVIKKTGGTDTVPVKFVAAEAGASNETVLVYPCLPTAVFRATCKTSATFANGTKIGIEATTLAPDSGNTTQTIIETVGQDERTTTKWLFVSLGWLA